MKDLNLPDAEYLVRRHELNVARQFMPELGTVFIATGNAGLGRSIQALLRVIFGYEPIIKTYCTIGAVLDGLAESSPDMVIFDDCLRGDHGFSLVSLFGGKRCLSNVVVISKTCSAVEILEIKQAGVADIIDPGQLDSARLTEAYIRTCVFSVLEEAIRDDELLKIQLDEKGVIRSETRTGAEEIGKRKALLRA